MLVSCVLALGACAGGDAPPPASEESADAEPITLDTGWYVFACDGGYAFSARFEGPEAAAIEVPGTARTPGASADVSRVETVSGPRWEGGGVTFWTEGDEAVLETASGTHSACAPTPAEDPLERARMLGVDFRGLGQEPGWLVDIDAGNRLELLYDYATSRVAAPAPEPVVVEGVAIYSVRTAEHDMTITIEAESCTDPMSGRPYPTTVTVVLDGRELRGCGEPLTDAAPVGAR